MLASDLSLRITEIFSSLQGESSYAGQPTTFVRLTGCPLRCVYCDSAYAFSGGETKTLAEILSRIESESNRYVCVTGGEPLSQPACTDLLRELCDRGYRVSLETSGALDIASIDSRVKKIVDVKTPSSRESSKNLSSNYDKLLASDEIKFVISDREDFDWSVEYIDQFGLFSRVENVFFSPLFELPVATSSTAERSSIAVKSPILRELPEWILAAGLPIRFQLQLHKIIWGDEPGR